MKLNEITNLAIQAKASENYVRECTARGNRSFFKCPRYDYTLRCMEPGEASSDKTLYFTAFDGQLAYVVGDQKIALSTIALPNHLTDRYLAEHKEAILTELLHRKFISIDPDEIHRHSIRALNEVIVTVFAKFMADKHNRFQKYNKDKLRIPECNIVINEQKNIVGVHVVREESFGNFREKFKDQTIIEAAFHAKGFALLGALFLELENSDPDGNLAFVPTDNDKNISEKYIKIYPLVAIDFGLSHLSWLRKQNNFESLLSKNEHRKVPHPLVHELRASQISFGMVKPYKENKDYMVRPYKENSDDFVNAAYSPFLMLNRDASLMLNRDARDSFFDNPDLARHYIQNLLFSYELITELSAKELEALTKQIKAAVEYTELPENYQVIADSIYTGLLERCDLLREALSELKSADKQTLKMLQAIDHIQNLLFWPEFKDQFLDAQYAEKLQQKLRDAIDYNDNDFDDDQKSQIDTAIHRLIQERRNAIPKDKKELSNVLSLEDIVFQKMSSFTLDAFCDVIGDKERYQHNLAQARMVPEPKPSRWQSNRISTSGPTPSSEPTTSSTPTTPAELSRSEGNEPSAPSTSSTSSASASATVRIWQSPAAIARKRAAEAAMAAEASGNRRSPSP